MSDELSILRELRHLAGGRASLAALDYLRDREYAARDLVIQCADLGANAWLVGPKAAPVAFAPCGSGMLPLARLLEQPGKVFSIHELSNAPCTAAAMRERVMCTLSELVRVFPGFAALRPRISRDGERLVYRRDAKCPRVDVSFA